MVGPFPEKDFDLGRNEHHGALELREALASLYGCGVENVVTANGGSEANLLAFLSLLNRGDDFLAETPGYQLMWLVSETLGARRIPLPRRYERDWVLEPAEVERRMTSGSKLLVLTESNNPTGRFNTRV